MKQWVGLLDCNNFFVSCERLFRPDLIGKPVAVLSSNDGCIVARSKEVKDIGIPMGVPYFKIKDILKTENVTLFSGNLTLYRDISKRVFEAMETVLESIEKYSIDEAFFVLRGTEDEISKQAQVIKDTVEKLVGVPVSIGVAQSKTLAKLANNEAKRTTGLFVLTEAKWRAKQSQVQLSEVWGVGAQLSKKFRSNQLTTISDLLRADNARIKQLFGIVGLRLKKELSGNTFVFSRRSTDAQKSLMSSRTFKESTLELKVLRKSLAYHVHHVGEQLRKANLKTTALQVSISPSRFGDFALQNVSKEIVFSVPTNTTAALLTAGNTLLEQMYKAEVPYKKLGVVATNLISAEISQPTFFDTKESNKLEELQASIDLINKTARGGKIRFGTVASDNTWKPRSDLRSPSYTTKWSDLPKIRA